MFGTRIKEDADIYIYLTYSKNSFYLNFSSDSDNVFHEMLEKIKSTIPVSYRKYDARAKQWIIFDRADDEIETVLNSMEEKYKCYIKKPKWF